MYRAHNQSTPAYSSPSMDSYTTVTYRKNPGYFERVGSSFCGIFIGIILLVASFPLIYYNEGRAVQTAKSLDEGLGVLERLSSSDIIFDSNNNKLVHLSGKLKTDLPLTDLDFGVQLHAVKLKREVEMYQWVEHEQKREYNEGDRTRIETTYSYSKEWRASAVSSGSFNMPSGHQNPGSFPVQAYTKVADPVFVGQFQLSKGLCEKVSNFRQFLPKSAPSHRSDLTVLEHYFYKSRDPYSPQVGDVRISFSFAGLSNAEQPHLGDQHEVSIVARQNGMFLSWYQTEAGDKLELLYDGNKSAEEIFESEHRANTILTWCLRFLGWLMMFIAFQIIMDPLRQISSFLPIVRDIVSLATSVVAFTLATSLALLTIAICWIRFRPLLGASIILAGLVPLYLSRRKAEREAYPSSKKETRS